MTSTPPFHTAAIAVASGHVGTGVQERGLHVARRVRYETRRDHASGPPLQRFDTRRAAARVDLARRVPIRLIAEDHGNLALGCGVDAVDASRRRTRVVAECRDVARVGRIGELDEAARLRRDRRVV